MTSFQFLGFACFLITTDEGVTILVDPYIDDNQAAPIKTENLPKIDLILVSHGAFDHMKDTSKIAKRDGSKIICGGEVMSKLIDEGVCDKQIAQTVWGLEVAQCGVHVRPVVSMHRSSVTLSNGTVMSGFALGFIIKLKDGTRIYNASDTALFSDMKLIGEWMKPDIGLINVTIENCFDFLPEFLTGEMTPEEAAIACDWLDLKYAIACHYSNINNKDILAFVNATEKVRARKGGDYPKPVVLELGGVFEYSGTAL